MILQITTIITLIISEYYTLSIYVHPDKPLILHNETSGTEKYVCSKNVKGKENPPVN